MKKGSSRLLRLSHYVELPVCPFRACPFRARIGTRVIAVEVKAALNHAQ
jgi:hypothetical protein